MTQLSIQRDAALKDYLTVVAKLPRANAGQRSAWMQDWREGDAEAGRLLLESFLHVVVAEAAARRGLGARFEALLAVGNRALAKALGHASAAAEGVSWDAAVRHSVVTALKNYWIKTSEKGS